jgi:hypothetical protein
MSMAAAAVCVFVACGDPSTSGSGSEATLEGEVDCSSVDLISTDIDELDPNFDFPDDPETSLSQYLNASNRLDGVPEEKFQKTSGNEESTEVGTDVTYSAAEDGKKVAEITIDQIDKDDWGVVEFSACQSFIDKYRPMDDPK